jgi:GT2 family glycosyltransferase
MGLRSVPETYLAAGERSASAAEAESAGGVMAGQGEITLSVIIPVHQASGILEETLGALARSDFPRERWELIIVDDASTDDSSVIGARYADTIVRLPGRPKGPAYARNRGFEVSRGAYIVFVDSDVCVHPSTLSGFVRAFEEEPEAGAVFGSYDDDPPAPGIVSQYRNLLHHYVHQQSAGDAETFWAGCGAVRRDVFAETGMFDEWHFSRPQIEDIELGRRIRQAGYRILLRPEIQGTHLKHWTLGNVLTTDFKSRGVPWTRLIMHEGEGGGSSPATLNIRAVQKMCTGLVGLGFIAALGSGILRSPWPLVITGSAVGMVLGVNIGFYRLLRRVRGFPFALAALPLHLMYYLSNCLSLAMGWLAHTVVGAPHPPLDVAAFSEVGVETWPPVPAKPKRSIWVSHDS